ncbi:hypothetical protein PBI_DEWDROP_59 [Microbacterium phage Dewdrop]|nr:hypothetical protein PBI_LEAF_59 [Microbacterium phage Leaf]QGZ17428.1 hypothetical protein PBI_DEWDROP_59 [Microbacterium phage Dewdrop]
MGDCNCGKNSRPTGFGSNPTQEQRLQEQLLAQSRNQPMNGAQEQARAAGGQQSFTLRDRSGAVQSFGSSLERNAFMARQGGTIL